MVHVCCILIKQKASHTTRADEEWGHFFPLKPYILADMLVCDQIPTKLMTFSSVSGVLPVNLHTKILNMTKSDSINGGSGFWV